MAGSTSFGGSIKLTGESDYRKALKDITSDMRLMSSQMKVLATDTDSSGKSSDADKAKKAALTAALGEQKAKLVELNAALQDSVTKTGSSSNSTKALQTQVNNATAQINGMEQKLGTLGTGLGDVGKNMDDAGRKSSIFGDVLKANLASDAIVGSIKAIGSGIASLGKAFVGMVGDSVKAFADYEQLTGGVETLFKGSAGTIEGYANTAYKTAGLSANQYMSTITTFSAAMVSGLKGDTAAAAEASNQAVTDMADNANKMGTDISMLQNSYQGFAKQNYTMLDNLKLGYGGTAEEMARLVNNSGVLGKGVQVTAETVKNVPFNQITQAIHTVQTEMGITGTTAKEAATTISGSFNSVKSSWENVLTSFGTGSNEQIKQAVDGLIESATNLVGNVTKIIPSIIGGIGQAATALIAQIPTLVANVLPVLVTSIQSMITQLVTILPQLIPVVISILMSLVNLIITNLPMIIQAGIDILLGLIDGIAQALPQLIPQIVLAIETIITTLVQNLPAIILMGIQLLIAIVQGLAAALPQLIQYIPQIINTLITTLTNPTMMKLIIQASIQLIIAIIGGLIAAIPSLIAAVPQIITALVNGIKNGIGSLASVGGDLVKGLWNGISGQVDWILGKVKSFGSSILNGIKSFFGIHSPSTLFRDEVGVNLGLGVGEGFSSTMSDVSKQMQDAIPTSFNTDVSLNNSGLAASVSDNTTYANSLKQDSLVSAMQTALKTVKIELDDKKVGAFVTNTIQGAIYG